MRRFVLRRMHPHRCRPHGQGLLSCTKASGFTCTHGGIASRSARDRPMHEVGRFDSRFLFFQSSLFRPRTVWNRDVRFLSISRRGMRRIVSLRSRFRLDLFLCGCGSRSPRPPLSSLRRTRTSRTTTYPQASFPGSPVHGIFSFLFFFIFLFPTRSYRFLPPLLLHPFLLRGCEGASAPGPGPGRTPPPPLCPSPSLRAARVCLLPFVGAGGAPARDRQAPRRSDEPERQGIGRPFVLVSWWCQRRVAGASREMAMGNVAQVLGWKPSRERNAWK